jgi:hypothetical protein
MPGGPLKPIVLAILVAALVVYLNQIAEARWYPLAPDMGRWLAISLGLFVFFAVVKILTPKRSSLD